MSMVLLFCYLQNNFDACEWLQVIDVFEESFAYADYLMILDNVIEYIEMYVFYIP